MFFSIFQDYCIIKEYSMGILEKTVGLAGVAIAGGVALTKGLLGGNKKKLAELDTEFARTTADYQAGNTACVI